MSAQPVVGDVGWWQQQDGIIIKISPIQGSATIAVFLQPSAEDGDRLLELSAVRELVPLQCEEFRMGCRPVVADQMDAEVLFQVSDQGCVVQVRRDFQSEGPAEPPAAVCVGYLAAREELVHGVKDQGGLGILAPADPQSGALCAAPVRSNFELFFSPVNCRGPFWRYAGRGTPKTGSGPPFGAGRAKSVFE